MKVQLTKTTAELVAGEAIKLRRWGKLSGKIDEAPRRKDGGITVEVDGPEVEFMWHVVATNDLSKVAHSLGRQLEKAGAIAPAEASREGSNMSEGTSAVVEPTESELEELARAKESGAFDESAPSGGRTRKPKVELGPEIDFEEYAAKTPKGKQLWLLGSNGRAHVPTCGMLRGGATDAIRVPDPLDLSDPWHKGEKGVRGLAIVDHCQCIWRPVNKLIEEATEPAAKAS